MPEAPHVLFAVDFDEDAHDAVREAVRIATLYDAKVSLVHVMPSFWRHWISSGLTDKQARDRLERWASKVAEQGVEASHHVLPFGNVADALLAFAEQHEVSLIVTGAHTKSFLERQLMGQTAEAVARSAAQSVWIRHRPPHEDLQRVLCGVDGSASSRRALEEAARICQRSKAALTIVSAIGDPTPHPLDLSEAEAQALAEEHKQRHSQEIEAFVGDCDLGEVDARRAHVWGHPWEVLLNMAQDENYDLVVVGRTGAGRVRRVVIGGTAERFLRRAPCSVLIIGS